MDIINLQERYQQAKQTLNEEQRQAVESTEGPVLTIAGPGTGKTQVLTLRICELLQNTIGLSPYNILCLTYTDAAVFSMRKRLVSFMGKEAYKVQICTYHSFCSQVIQQNPNYFSENQTQHLIPIDNLAYFDLIRALFLSLEAYHPLKRLSGDLFNGWKHLKSLFELLEKEQIEEDFIFQEIDSYETTIENDTTNKIYFYQKTEKKGLPKPKLTEEKQRLSRLKAAIGLKKTFDEMLKQKGYYTFEQMIMFVIKAFEKHNDLLLDYQERFQYILVDEYQDTNNSQNKIIFQLCQYWEQNPNLFVVGDDDQSIYRFQGANLENILHFREKYASFLTEVRLNKNYRSSQQILDAAEAFIQSNTQRLLPHKQLIAENETHQAQDNKIYIEKYKNLLDEEIGVVRQIQYLIEQEKVNPSEIAILFTKHKQGERIQQILSKQNLPFELHARSDIFKESLVDHLLDLLVYFSQESKAPHSQDALLFKCLHFHFWKIPSTLLLSIYLKNDKKRSPNLRLTLTELKEVDFPEFDAKHIMQLKELARKLEKILSEIHNLNNEYFVQKVIYDLGILEYAHAEEERVWLLQVLYTFFDFVKQEHQKHPFSKIESIINRVKEYKDQKESIPMLRIIRQEPSVKLMTVFASKGLEFEYVFMIKNTPDAWEEKRKNADPYRLPKSIFKHQSTSQNEETDIEELRRLFYVGLTRAKKKVFVSYAEFDDKEKNVEPSQLVIELVQSGKTNLKSIDEINTCIIDKNEQIATLCTLLKPTSIDRVKIELEANDVLERKLDGFELSASTLKQYLDCPLGFYYNNIVKLPRASTPDQAYGKSVHLALKKIYPNKREGKLDYLSKNEFLFSFEENFAKHQSHFNTQDSYYSYVQRARHQLPLFYDKHIKSFKEERIVQIEYPVHLIVQDVPVMGILDKLIFNGNKVTIVDYKTGSYAKSSKETKRFNAPKDDNDHGGEYWRQGAFYKMLIDNVHLKRPDKKWKTEAVLFQYIEPENGEFFVKEFTYTEEQMQQLLTLIKNTWERIQHKDFAEGCGKAECQWCTFAKNYHIQITEFLETDEA